MSAQHTPGKLNFYDDRNSTGRIEVVGLGKTVARIYLSVPDEDVANARRLVACWNACIDEGTNYLEAIVEQGSTFRKRLEEAFAIKEKYQSELCEMERERDALKQQNAELLEALKRIAEMTEEPSIAHYARAAIAKAGVKE